MNLFELYKSQKKIKKELRKESSSFGGHIPKSSVQVKVP